MGKAGKLIVALVVVAVVAAIGVWAFGRSSDKNNDTQQATGNNATPTATITYNGSSFEPDNLTVSAGSTVKIVNDSDAELDFSSDPHPIHTDNPQLNAGVIEPGASKSVTLTTKGNWGYHNHLSSSQRGSITVD